MKIYHVPGTRSIRPIWLCYELGLEVEIVTIDSSEEFRSSQDWLDISPAGKVPALTDGELTMFESGAMIGYLLDRYGNGQLQPPAGSHDSARFQQWCWFSEATLIRPLGLARMLRDSEGLGETAKAKTLQSLQVVEDHLQNQTYLLGTGFTAADVMMGYSLHLLEKFQVLSRNHPNCRQYLAQLRTRDACARAFRA